MRAIAPFLLTALVAGLGAAERLPANGDFEGGAAGWGLSGGASIAEEGGNHFLRLPGPGMIAPLQIPVPPGSGSVTVALRIRASGVVLGDQAWQDVRIAGERLAADGKLLGYGPTPHVAADTTGWVPVSDSVELPADCTVIKLTPSVLAKAGAADFDDIVVTFGAGKPQPAGVPASDAAAPAGTPAWADAKVVATSPLRGEIALDGAWRFAPTAAKEAPTVGWGWITVPSSWRDERSVLARGEGGPWASFDRNALRGAWYEREIAVPAAWKGRAILLDLARVSTDATVYLDDQRCGVVNWPEGSVDLTAAVKPGATQRLRLHVVATLDKDEVMVLMGNLPGQNSVAKAQLQTGGLTGAVRLLSRPSGPRVDDVLVRTSVRRGELGFDLDLAEVAAAGDVAIEAVILGADGVEAKRFTATVPAKAAARQTVNVAWPWADAKRWDIGQPNLYTAIINARGAGITDAYAQRFGFRECWVEGRKLMLNGNQWRMRPMLRQPRNADEAREALARGHDFCEIWPGDPYERSAADFAPAYAIADEVGLPINGVTPHMGWYGGNINSPEKIAAYRVACERLIRRARNHPGVVMWGTSGNMTGGALNPAVVGQREGSLPDILKQSAEYPALIPRAKAGIDIHHELDPTRPAFIHNGGANGDIYTINNYLTQIPLQEREEWLSAYAEKGDMPLSYVEYGTPVSLDYMRARNGFQNAVQSEPLFSEFLAIELGPQAFRDETAAYRTVIREKFQKDQTYGWMHGERSFFEQPAFLAVQARFITNTWRSWRTMGITAGMIPWDDGYYKLGGKITPAGTAMQAANGPTLAWICGADIAGDRAAFTAKDHAFSAGAKVAKRVALLNDARAPRPWSLTWKATLGGREIGAGTAKGSLEVAGTVFAPIAFDLPARLAGDKVDGEIALEATIGDAKHVDRFAFRAFAPLAPASGEVLVHDPAGKTSALLAQLGYRAVPWTGAADAKRLLVIGRGALSEALPLPGDLAAFVRAGGRAIIQAQDPHHVRALRGLRMSYKASRRVYPIDPAHPAVAGLDAEDLRDWTGHGTLVEAKPDYINGTGPEAVTSEHTRLPYAGWRWGLRGSVATGAPEKPHRSGWRPILECEFDLAYSPLMELDLGRGRLIWCQLDLEDHAALDPAAARLARQVVEYARSAPLAPRVAATYLGGDAGAKLLDQVGLTYQRAKALPASGLAVIGADAGVDRAALEAFANGGGQVLVLPRAQADAGLGLRLAKRDDSIGSLTPPAWPECRGLSASDLRARAESPAWLIADGAEIGADGLIGRRVVGRGAIVFCQVDPDRFDADTRTYLRFSRWRSTRAIAQLLANLGGAFAFDERILTARPPTPKPDLPLAGPWKAKQTKRLPAATGNNRNADPGIGAEARALLAADVDDAGWEAIELPKQFESLGGAWADADGEAVVRRAIDVPAALAGQPLVLELGAIDDFDLTCVNGVEVGGMPSGNGWNTKRVYAIKPGVIKPGRNVIAVRVWDHFGGGGFTGLPTDLVLRPATDAPPEATMYHPDYRTDWDRGDEPGRYYNW